MSKSAVLKGSEWPLTPKLLHRFFEERAKEHPNAVALIVEDEQKGDTHLTYQELNAISNRVANKLLDIIKGQLLFDNKDGDWLVCLAMKPSISLVVMMLAVWKAGAAYLPVDISISEEKLSHILDEAMPTLFVFDDSFEHLEYVKKSKAYSFKDLEETSAQLSTENISDDETMTGGDCNVAFVLFTSGSTGLAKGVRIHHDTAQIRLEWQWKEYPYADDESHFVFKTTVMFIDHFGEIWNPLLAGKTVVVVPKDSTKNPEKLVPILEKFNVRRLIAVPTLIRSLLTYLLMIDGNEKKQKLANLTLWVNSGEALKLQLANEFFDYFGSGTHTLATFYGSTEVMGDVVSFSVSSSDELEGFESFPIGKPSYNTVVYVVDENKKLLKEEEVGEIYIAGGFVTGGYVNDQNANCFIRNHLSRVPYCSTLYRIGDFGFIKDGLLFYVGRRDTQIKIHGHRVDIIEIENTVNALRFLEKSSIQVWNRAEIDQAVLAFVTVKQAFSFMTEKDIQSEIRQKLPGYIVPQVVLLNQFPSLLNGKVDRQGLLKTFEKINESKLESIDIQMDLKGVAASEVETAKNVFRIISESIGHTMHGKLSTSTNFYDIGGNSLNTIFCVNQLRKENFEISITDFLEAKTLGEVLAKINNRRLSSASRTECMVAPEMELRVRDLDCEMQSACVTLLAESFTMKGDLNVHLKNLKLEHTIEHLNLNWPSLMDQGLSFLVLNGKDQIVGVSLNFDIENGLRQVPESPLETIFDYFEFVEHGVVPNPAPCDKIMESFMMGTSKELNSKENIQVIVFMEKQVLNLAKIKNFTAIVTTNTNQLTQQLAVNVLGYKTLKEFQVNRYVDKFGIRPFKDADDSQKTLTMWKDIDGTTKTAFDFE